MSKRIPVEAKRVPLNCLVAPITRQRIERLCEAGMSQGEIVDLGVGMLAREPTMRKVAITGDKFTVSEPLPNPAREVSPLGGTVSQERGVKVETRESFSDWRAGRKPLLKPSERKK